MRNDQKNRDTGATAMPGGMRLAALFSLACLACLLQATAAHALEFQTARSRHYTVHTNGSGVVATEMAKHMDKVFAEYSRRFKSFEPKRTERMDLYLIQTREQYIRFLSEKGIPAGNSGGLFAVSPTFSGLITFMEDRPRSETLKVLQHEGFHQFAFNYIGHNLPSWINEGLAQYFEDGIMINGRMRLGVPDAYRQQLVKKALRENRLVPFDEVLGMTSKEWLATLQRNQQKSAMLYAQSWSICYFLIHARNGRYRPALETYLRAVANGAGQEDAFVKAYGGTDTEDMEARWREAVVETEPDPLSVAVNNLEFLGQGLLALRKTGAKEPDSFSELETMLRRGSFRVTKMMHGMSMTVTSEDETLFRYLDSKGRTMPFVLKRTESKDYPPTLIAPKVQPTPSLYWTKDPDGDLVPEIRWR